MLPISEFHFAFCGIATVAATLGYACARRAAFSLAPANEPSKADVEAGSPSLKRKLDHSDEHDTDAEELSRPMKRNRTPPTDKHRCADEDEWEVVVAPPPPYEQVAQLPQSQEYLKDNGGDLHIVEQDATPIQAPVPTAQAVPSPEPKEGRCATPQPPQVAPLPNEIPPAQQDTPRKPAVPAKVESVKAFSAFSGSSSPFASYSNPSGTSPFSLAGQNAKTAPAWRRANDAGPDAFGRASSPNALAPSPNDTAAAPSTETAFSQNKTALAVPKETRASAKPSTCLTGEEGETVEAELKGVKLFIKRGRKEFTDGMYGHIKILTQKPTPQNEDPAGTDVETHSRTRLLFRRDPLGQVSMNVGLHPTVRCHFDSAENILRAIVMEKVTTDGNSSKEDVVVYALKPGRAQKADFQSFSKTLCDHDGLKPRAGTSPTTPTRSGAAAAP